ncbi:osmotically inducible protein OsmC [Limimaricola soesokkakensis]|uniref:Osmotically inducible protein OsmC n=1 Tax=Limimaricola soesokkakensis TaxID=1343159 RepID=A0A1X6YGK6_9RHOB|nr:OsmC family peroxiredoxin [Limimaricola soesokkakensis]PSK82201.1 osmotically inducible protein OsmC [Limimaricola soesokkakensis]SLN18851.1 Peroxiredoxin OsmC [Limimaricola soesokkakensis]
MIKKHGKAHWSGGIKEGGGEISTQTGVLKDQPYGFNARFEGGPGTNPEELIGAAHAACYAMALSLELGKDELTADDIDVQSTVSLEKVGEGFEITKIHLDVTAKVPGASEEQFRKATEATKTGCPVSKLLKAAEITMDAKLA